MVLFSSARPGKRANRHRKQPSLAAIRRATAAIREGWSPRTRRRRSCAITDPMTVTEVPYLATRIGVRSDFTLG
jgi:hypothetical protein